MTAQATGLQRKLGAHDRQTLDDYLEGVREIERRLTRAESQVAANADIVIPRSAVRQYRSSTRSTCG